MKEKKSFKDTKFGQFLNKAKDIVPELGNIGVKLVTGNISGVVEEVGGLLKKKAETDEKAKDLYYEFEANKMQFRKDCFALEVEDRKDARSLYGKDSIIQKIFAIVFLIGYGFLCWYMLEILKGESQDSELFKTMVTMIFTGTSTKLGTIIDFFFGGAVK